MDEQKLELVFAQLHPVTHEQFLESLRYLRYREPKWMFVAQPATDYPYQGDVISEGEIALVQVDGIPIRYSGPVMLLSHGCDTVEGVDVWATVAPVIPIADVLADRPDDVDPIVLRGKIESNQLTHRLYLPATNNLPESVVEFGAASAVAVPRINQLWGEAAWKERLTRQGWFLMTGKLAYHYSRLEKGADYTR